MIIQRTLAASALLLATSSFAQPSNNFCEDITCFTESYKKARSINLQDAPKLAWRPGIYNRKGSTSSSDASSRSSGWNWGSSVPSTGPANPNGTFIFYTRDLSWGFYNSSGNLVKSGPASGGMGYCEDVGRSCRTPVGRFRVYAKGPADCISNKYPLGEGGAPMPHCMYFNGGYAIHGSYHVPNYHASHGCIRLRPSDAAWLYSNFMRVGTVVIVKPY